jgi:hypothetical protein
MSAATVLCGMKAICEHCRSISLPSSESTIISMVRKDGFPAKKIGGIWISNADAIIEWTKSLGAVPDPVDQAIKSSFKNPVNPQKHLKNTSKTPKTFPKLP